jgi:hypothetical protein
MIAVPLLVVITLACVGLIPPRCRNPVLHRRLPRCFSMGRTEHCQWSLAARLESRGSVPFHGAETPANETLSQSRWPS